MHLAQAKNQRLQLVIGESQRRQCRVFDQGKPEPGLAINDCTETTQGVDVAMHCAGRNPQIRANCAEVLGDGPDRRACINWNSRAVRDMMSFNLNLMPETVIRPRYTGGTPITEPIMLTLLTYPSAFGLFSASPFCVKTAYMLQLAGLHWRRSDMVDPRQMPHSKLPVLRTPERLVPDLSLIHI